MSIDPGSAFPLAQEIRFVSLGCLGGWVGYSLYALTIFLYKGGDIPIRIRVFLGVLMVGVAVGITTVTIWIFQSESGTWLWDIPLSLLFLVSLIAYLICIETSE